MKLAIPAAAAAAPARVMGFIAVTFSSHLPYPAAPIGPALVNMAADDRTEAIAILERPGDPRQSATDDDT